MAADIAPELYEKIEKEFEKRLNADKDIQSFLKKKKEKKATSEEVSLYAANLGKCASKALISNLTEENLPNGRLYWNIAERTIIPLLKKVHGMVNDAAIEVDGYEDERNGIHIIGQRTEFPVYRARDLVNKMVELFGDIDE